MRGMATILICLCISPLGVRAEDIAERLCPEGMVYVPAGRAIIGSEVKESKHPVRTVVVGAFYIDQYPVTNAQFKAFVDATGHRTLIESVGSAYIGGVGGRLKRVSGACWKAPEGPTSTIEDRMDHPVIHIGYRDAEAYCQWVGKRLPTEAEWEKACRGTDGRKFPWGNEWKEGRYTSTRYEDPKGVLHHRVSPVWKYPYASNPYGAMDMIGNVWQWCSDESRLNERYIFRVLKGNPHAFRPYCSSRRAIDEKDDAMVHTGFRCAKDVQW